MKNKRFYPNLKDSNSNEKWAMIEAKLGNLFRSLANTCFDKGLISQVERERYFVSVTEKEIFNGILNAKKSVPNNVLFFIREIENLEEECEKFRENNSLALLKKFIDMDNDNRIDESARSLLNDLKYKKIPVKLPESNIFKFNVSIQKYTKYIRLFSNSAFFC